MLKRVGRAEQRVAQCKRALEDAERELEEARKRVDEVGGEEAAKLLERERKWHQLMAAALSAPLDLPNYAWKLIEGDPVCSNDECPNTLREEHYYYKLRWVDGTTVACDTCQEMGLVVSDWDNVRFAMPDLMETWRKEATLPKYHNEGPQEMLQRLESADEWIRGDKDCEIDLHCAMTYAGCTSGLTHGCCSVYALKGAPGMLLCEHHIDKRHDTALMRYLLAFILWGHASGVADRQEWAPLPPEGWGPGIEAGACHRCKRPANQGGEVVDWWGAVSVIGEQFVWMCGDCYADYRRPCCIFCNESYVPKCSDGELQMQENLLTYTCKKVHG